VVPESTRRTRRQMQGASERMNAMRRTASTSKAPSGACMQGAGQHLNGAGERPSASIDALQTAADALESAPEHDGTR
jgi:hypothetical protein